MRGTQLESGVLHACVCVRPKISLAHNARDSAALGRSAGLARGKLNSGFACISHTRRRTQLGVKKVCIARDGRRWIKELGIQTQL